MKRVLSIALLVSLLGLTATANAASLIRVPADQPTIQAGLNAAGNGDTVLVAAGTYTGPDNRALDFYGKSIKLRSESGPGVTTIACQHLDRCFNFHSGEGNASLVEGFTITDGQAPVGPVGGGGMLINGASPTIRNCVITSCHSEYVGGGIDVANGLPIIDSCTFSFNGAASHGGGLKGAAILSNCDFVANEALGTSGVPADGGGAHLTGSSTVKSCRFAVNNARRGGALYLAGDKNVENCLFVANQALVFGGSANNGGAVYANSGAISFEFCTFYGNDALDSGLSIYSNQAQVGVYHSIAWDSPSNGLVSSPSGTINASYSDIWQSSGVYTGDGNLNADPLFVSGPGSPTFNGYYLRHTSAGQGADSPCVDAGHFVASFWMFCDFGHGDDVCMDHSTTRTSHMPDGDLVDLGYHYYEGMTFGDGFESGDTTGWDQTVP